MLHVMLDLRLCYLRLKHLEQKLQVKGRCATSATKVRSGPTGGWQTGFTDVAVDGAACEPFAQKTWDMTGIGSALAIDGLDP
jgi:hypothetical protein